MQVKNATPEFNAALEAFVNAVQVRSDVRYAQTPRLEAPKFSVMPGSKNVRVVSSQPGSRYVFCFVRIADGAVLKADGWKAPAKHARGSIFVNNGQDAVSDYGANYIVRGGR
jgi:hypothetical protein